MEDKYIVLLVIVACCFGVILGYAFDDPETKYVQNHSVSEKLIKADCPVCPAVTCSFDSFELTDLWEAANANLISEIEGNATDDAEAELEEDDYEVISDFLIGNISGIDEDSIDFDVDDVEVVVTNVGRDNDEDKTATVTFKGNAEYELEEGIVQDYSKNLIVVFDVTYDEGDFDDEKVSLISIA